MLMIDGGCGAKGPGSHPCMESSGNGSTGGVTAFPDELADANLTRWTRSGPTVFEGCDGSAGPSPILANARTGRRELLAIHGGHEALFAATDDSLASWKMVDPAFVPARGGGGGLWHVLPPAPAGAAAAASAPSQWTHIMQLNMAGLGDGGASFALMRVDAATSTVTNLSATTALDSGSGVRYGQLSAAGGTARGGGAGDQRKLHVSWLTDAVRSAGCDPSDIDVGQLTCFRDVRYDARLPSSGAPRGVVVSTSLHICQVRRAARRGRPARRDADRRVLRAARRRHTPHTQHMTNTDAAWPSSTPARQVLCSTARRAACRSHLRRRRSRRWATARRQRTSSSTSPRSHRARPCRWRAAERTGRATATCNPPRISAPPRRWASRAARRRAVCSST